MTNIKPLYDIIGDNYDDTRCADPFILKSIIDLLRIRIDSSVLDVACGTGNYTVGLRNLGYNITGLDCSNVMLNKAKNKSDSVSWVCGDVEYMPFHNSTFDACYCTLAIHHFQNLNQAFKEVFRIMKCGHFVIFTCTHKQIRNYWLYRYFPEVLDSMTQYIPDFPVVIDALCNAGFSIKSVVPYFISDELEDCFLGCKRKSPELYLDPAFRNGMSIFSAKAKATQVDLGCRNLEADIKSGAFEKFIAHHKNPIGDYLFIQALKE